MNNILISKEKVLKIIDTLGYSNCHNSDDYKANSKIDKIRQSIVEMKVDYDVDAVCKELEEAAFYTQPTFDEDGYSNDDSEEVIHVCTAIEIARNGGNERK